MDTCNSNALSVVFAGHVDHGKSSVLGRLLADCQEIAPEKLDKLRLYCQRHGKLFEYAFLTDALKEERAQGITIDCARIPFQSPSRFYQLIDAPGHVEFLKNWVTGASTASAAVLVIDALEGVRANSRRHGKLLSLLGLKELVVLVNKMDAVGYAESIFFAIEKEYRDFLNDIGLTPRAILPVSAREGDNIASRSMRMAWYRGPSLFELLEDLPQPPTFENQALRLPIQDIYKFGDDKRYVAGTISSGSLRLGDSLVFYPSKKRARVKGIESFPHSRQSAKAGEATALTLEPELYLARGEIAARATEAPPQVSTQLEATLFWLSREALVQHKSYELKLGSSATEARVAEILDVCDADSLISKDAAVVQQHDVARVRLQLKKEVAFDLEDCFTDTRRFVLVDGYRLAGGGLIHASSSLESVHLEKKLEQRGSKWISGSLSSARRAERFFQRPALLLVTGTVGTGRKNLARALEWELFERGHSPFYFGMGSLIYGLGADLAANDANRSEQLRRLGEAAHLMLEAGHLVIASAQEITEAEKLSLEKIVAPASLKAIWVGEARPTLRPDLSFSDLRNKELSHEITDTLLFLRKERIIRHGI